MKDEAALYLHDRASLGEPLTDEERTQLASWYAAQDAAEAREASPANADLVAQIQAALGQVDEVTRQIRETMAQNDSLRREIASLRLELAQQDARSAPA